MSFKNIVLPRVLFNDNANNFSDVVISEPFEKVSFEKNIVFAQETFDISLSGFSDFSIIEQVARKLGYGRQYGRVYGR